MQLREFFFKKKTFGLKEVTRSDWVSRVEGPIYHGKEEAVGLDMMDFECLLKNEIRGLETGRKESLNIRL